MNDLFIKLLELSSKGYCCSQIMLQLGLETMDRENPDLVRAMAGLCMGTGGGVCGILSGAACLIALYTGKGGDMETENVKMAPMLHELNDWFSEYTENKYDGIACEQIVGEVPDTPDMGSCGELMIATYTKVMEILVENGIDPSGESDE